MKTKHLFYSLALASAFAACTQEELVEAPVVKDNVADRPVAGVVEFSTEGVESRFNYEKANGFELGDVFGLYLMDEFVDGNAAYENNHKAEHWNANTTYWIYQNHWFGMYNFTNSIQSNYPFTYKSEGGKKVWKNDAKLVEGNYFAMFPQNEVALNRRELWHVIDPSVELKKVSSSTSENLKYQNVENQFWLGYKQIYRDATASAEGVMTMDLDMTGVLVPMKFIINNNSNNDVIIDKISFKNKLGRALPTLAYVRPAGKDWVKYTAADNEISNCDAKAHYLYNEAQTWTKQTIQNIVEWTVPGEENIPYGLEGAAAKTAYEYSFAYPTDVTLKGNVNGGSVLTTYIAVPAMEGEQQWKDLQVCIYGWQKDNGSATGWTYGMLSTKKTDDDDNYTFDLYQKLNAWGEQAEETDYYREVNVKFSEFAWKAVNQTEVAGTSDMEKMVKSYLAQNSGDQTVTIAPDATGVEVTKEFVDYLKANSQDKGRSIKLVFDGVRGGNVTFNDNNTMAINTITTETADGVEFVYQNGIKLINNAAQTVSDYEVSVPVENNGTLTVLAGGSMADVDNNAVMTISSNNDATHGGSVALLDNYGDLTLKCNSTVGTLNNRPAAKTVVDAAHKGTCKTATVTTFNNLRDEQCNGTCVPSELVVKSGILAVTSLTNDAKLTINENATIDVVTELINKVHNHGYTLVNNGTISGNGIVTNNGVIDNYGVMAPAKVANANTINGYAGEIENLENAEAGVIYIKSATIDVQTTDMCQGKIVFEGVENEHVSMLGGAQRIFRATAAMTTEELFPILSKIGANHIWTAYDLTMLKPSIKAADYAAIAGITIEGANVKFIGESGKTYNFTNATLEVNKDCKLSIEGNVTVVMLNRAADQGKVHVGATSTLNIITDVDHSDALPLPTSGEVQSGAYILSADMELTGDLTIAKDAVVKINLNDKTLKVGAYKFKNNGVLVIKNGAIESESVGMYNFGSAVVECTIKSANAALQNQGTLTITGGYYYTNGAKSATVYCNGAIDPIAAEDGAWKLTINGGEFVSENFTCISLENNYYNLEDNYGAANLNAGTFTANANWYDVYICAAVVNYKPENCVFTNDKIVINDGNEWPSLINGVKIQTPSKDPYPIK